MRTILSFLQEGKRRNWLLFYLAASLTLLFLVFLSTFWVCGYTPLLDICYWLKPFKFSLSFAIYVFTLGWFMEYLKPQWSEKKISWISYSIAVLITVEMISILLQSVQYSEGYARLDFSNQTSLSIAATLHVISNLAILVSTAIVLYVAGHFFTNISLRPRPYLWGIRAGFFVFAFSCFIGGFMLHHYGQVPPNHGDFGLPFTHLNSSRSDLISIHFLGIHAIQALPLAGFFLKKQLAYAVIFTLTALFIISGLDLLAPFLGLTALVL